jgi:hypothetical protein
LDTESCGINSKLPSIINAYTRAARIHLTKIVDFFFNYSTLQICYFFPLDYYSANIHLLDLLKNIGCTWIPKDAESIQNCLYHKCLYRVQRGYKTKIFDFFSISTLQIFLLFLSDYFSATIHLLDLLKNIGCTFDTKSCESIQNCFLISLRLH